MLFGEVVFFAGLEVDHPDHSILHDQRNGQFRMNIGHGFHVEVVLRCVGDQDGLARLGCASRDAKAHFDADALGDFRWVSHAEANVQFLPLLVEQQDGENLVFNDFLDDFGDSPQGGIEVKRGVDHVRYFEQKGIDLGLNVRQS